MNPCTAVARCPIQDKNKHPQADAAFRKVYGAFETLSDPLSQRRLLFELGFNMATTEVHAADSPLERWNLRGAREIWCCSTVRRLPVRGPSQKTHSQRP